MEGHLVSIRIATPDDAATLFALALKTFVDAFAPDNRAEDMDAYTNVAFGEAQQRRELEGPDIITIFAEEDGQPIGYVQLRRTPDAPHGDLEVARFYVDRDHHGRGVAQLLMTAVDDRARMLGVTRIWLGVWERNFRAIAFYQKVGFVRCSSHPFLLGSDLQTDWVMNRLL
ncbi:MAG: GNAT family N-acetyltransferase [Thermoanaerobaculia bacterium]